MMKHPLLGMCWDEVETYLSPYVATSKARRTFEKALQCFKDAENEKDVDKLEDLYDHVEHCRREYIRCLHNSAPTCVFQIIASFLSVADKCRYGVCSKFMCDEVVFGDSAKLVWLHCSNDDLFTVAKVGATNVLQQLIAAGCVDVNIQRDARTPLMEAIANDHTSIVGVLLEANAKVNFESQASLKCPLSLAATSTPKILSMVMDRTLSLQNHGWHALSRACGYGVLESVHMLLGAKVSPNAHGAADEIHGVPPLVAAACNGHQSIVSALLAAKAVVDATWTGDTALMFAVRNSNAEIVKMLLKSGACVDIVNSDGVSPFMHATSDSCSGSVSMFSRFRDVRSRQEREDDRHYVKDMLVHAHHWQNS